MRFLAIRFLMNKRDCFALGTTVIALTACGKGINGGPTVDVNFVASDATTAATAGALIGETISALSDSLFTPPGLRTPASTFGLRGTQYGSAAPTSFKYAIYEVKICEKLDISGTAFSNPVNCSVLFTKSINQADYDSSNVTVPYMDLIDMATTRATLNKGITVNPGSYNYGLINWFKPVLVTGSVALSGGGGTLYTKSDVTYDGSKNTTANMAVAPAQEAKVLLNNGGAWFKFQNPWVFDGKEAAQLDLVFDPQDLLHGSGVNSSYSIQSSTAGGPGLDVPLLALTPIVHKKTEFTQKEVYTVTGPNGDIRIELYFIKSDAAKTIYGVTLNSVYTATTAADLSNPPQVFSVSTSGANLVLQNYIGTAIATFARLTAEGDTGTLVLHCGTNGGTEGDFFQACGSSVTGDHSYPYTLSRIKDVF